MPNWDVFYSDRLELNRDLEITAVLDALARGDLREDDLIRPAGADSGWTRIGDRPDLLRAARPQPPPSSPPRPLPRSAIQATIADEPPEPIAEAEAETVPGPLDAAEHAIIPDPSPQPKAAEDKPEAPASERISPDPKTPEAPSKSVDDDFHGEFDLDLRNRNRSADLDRPPSSRELVAWDDDLDEEEFDPQEEDEIAAEFTLSRSEPERVEELDLAAMVDVAFQLVLFFLVTATTVMFKSLEVPKPNPDSRPPEAAAQGRMKSLDDMRGDYIVVEIDPAGQIKIDREPVPSDFSTLVERLRAARAGTERNKMLLSADFSTPHRSAVLAYDAANEIGLAIAIARPPPPEP